MISDRRRLVSAWMESMEEITSSLRETVILLNLGTSLTRESGPSHAFNHLAGFRKGVAEVSGEHPVRPEPSSSTLAREAVPENP